MNIKGIYQKYKDIILYGIFGVLTTLVNIVSYWGMAHLFKCSVTASTIVAWILAVLFAYVTNRKWVFHSDCYIYKEIIKEMIAFFSCRLATGFVDWICMFVLVSICGFNDILIKTFANGLVIILNYIASKIIIFKHERKK